MPSLHSLNILIHVTTGCIAIVLGLVLLARRKGDAMHRRLGRITVTIVAISMVAALAGAVLFRGKADLLGVTLLVSYHLWAGIRALRLRDNGRRPADLLPALAMLVLAAGLLALYRSGTAVNWEPARVYATVGGVAFYGGWDILRTVFPTNWRRRLNPAEHAFRMTSLVGALVSVAAGTLLPGYALYAALVPSALAVVAAVVFAVRAALRAAR